MNGSEEVFSQCRVDTSGRIVIPQAIRTAKGINNGDDLIVGLRQGTIVIQTYTDAMQQLQDAFCEGLDPNHSMVTELCENRRSEATDENGR